MRRPNLYVVPTRPRRSDAYGGLAIIVVFAALVCVVISLTHFRTKLMVSANLGRSTMSELGR